MQSVLGYLKSYVFKREFNLFHAVVCSLCENRFGHHIICDKSQSCTLLLLPPVLAAMTQLLFDAMHIEGLEFFKKMLYYSVVKFSHLLKIECLFDSMPLSYF